MQTVGLVGRRPTLQQGQADKIILSNQRNN